MKSQREIYEALLNGKVLINDNGVTVELDGNGRLCPDSIPFHFPEAWKLYSPPREPMTLEVECEWERLHGHAIVFPILDTIDHREMIAPFIGKRTKMVLTEILE